jgi:hypothetical protein
MSEFTDIFGEVIRLVTFQPREARMRYQNPQWEDRIHTPQPRKAATDAARGRDEGRDRV